MKHIKEKMHQRLKKEGKLVNFAPGPAALQPEQQGTAVEQEQQGPNTSSTATPTKRKTPIAVFHAHSNCGKFRVQKLGVWDLRYEQQTSGGHPRAFTKSKVCFLTIRIFPNISEYFRIKIFFYSEPLGNPEQCRGIPCFWRFVLPVQDDMHGGACLGSLKLMGRIYCGPLLRLLWAHSRGVGICGDMGKVWGAGCQALGRIPGSASC